MPNLNIPFTTPANYTFDSAKAEVMGGLGKLTTLFDFSSAVAHWKMNDNLATTNVVDEKGTFNGTAQQNTNLLSVPGLLNNALTFNGTADYIDLGTNSILSTGNWSIFCVFKTNNAATFRTIYCEGNTTSDVKHNIIQIRNNGIIQFTIQNGGANMALQSSSRYDDNAWHTFVAVKKASNDWEAYVDGNVEVLTSSKYITQPIIDTTGIGALLRTTNASYFDGEIDNIFIIRNIISASNILSWHNATIEELKGYDNTNPTIYLTSGLTATNVLNWSSFSVTQGTVDGTITYQLSNDGVNWQYWNGSSWTSATTETNLEATINSNISTFPITNEKIYVKTFFVSDGTQEVEIDNISITYFDNLSPNLDAGADKSSILNETIKPFSDTSFNDPDGTIITVEYKVDGEVDVWTEIPQGVFGSILEAVLDFDYTFNNEGTKTLRLRVTDDDMATTEDTLDVSVAKTEVTFNITDSDTGLHLSSVSFVPGDSGVTTSEDSPFTHNYGLGTYTVSLIKSGYFSVIQDITVSTSGETKNISMAPTTGVTETVQEIDIDIDTTPLTIKIEVQ